MQNNAQSFDLLLRNGSQLSFYYVRCVKKKKNEWYAHIKAEVNVGFIPNLLMSRKEPFATKEGSWSVAEGCCTVAEGCCNVVLWLRDVVM